MNKKKLKVSAKVHKAKKDRNVFSLHLKIVNNKLLLHLCIKQGQLSDASVHPD